MKILLANGTAFPDIGGVENSLDCMAQVLNKLGHEVKIFCFQRNEREPLRCVHNNIEIIRTPRNSSRLPWFNLKYAINAANIGIESVLKEYYPDAIWCRKTSVGLGIAQSSYQGKLLNIFPTTATMDSDGLYRNTRGLPWKRRLLLLGLWPMGYLAALRAEKKLLKCCNAVVFSALMRQQLISNHALKKENIALVNPGVDSDHFSYVNGCKYISHIRDTYHLNRKDPYVLYVGRLSVAKNITMLIDAMLYMKNKSPLIIVGSGAERERLEKYIDARKLAERVIFVGKQTKYLPAFYAMSKICVLPTTVESFGQTYIESMACGTPVVGFESNGKNVLTATQEIIKDGKTGLVVKEVSPQALSVAMDQILDLKLDEYETMSKMAINDMKKRYCWDSFVEGMIELQKKIEN